jgi:hypothetical protein
MAPDATQVVTAVVNDGSSGVAGSAAWHWGIQDCCNNLNSGSTLTDPYGQMVALYINTSVIPCTAAEATANANNEITSVTAQVAAEPQTPATTPATSQAATPSAATSAAPSDAAAAAASIAQANAIISGIPAPN